MDAYLMAIKDVLVIIAPIVVAYISYRSSKKTQKDIKLEVERITKEKEAETKQILEKIGAELESQKQLISWQNSIHDTNEYTSLIEVKRFGNISALPKLCQDSYALLRSCPPVEAITELNQMLDRIELPAEDEELYPFEVPIILNFKIMRNEVNAYLRNCCSENVPEEEKAGTEV